MDKTMAGEDYVHIRLSPAGEKLAGKGGQVQIVAGRWLVHL